MVVLSDGHGRESRWCVTAMPEDLGDDLLVMVTCLGDDAGSDLTDAPRLDFDKRQVMAAGTVDPFPYR